MLLPLRIQNLDTPAVATGGGSGAGAVDEPTRRKVCLCAGAPAPVKKAVKKMKKPRSGI
jgi:hypothetical protein